MKFRITAENKNTHERLTLCQFAGREWFVPTRPHHREAHFYRMDAEQEIKRLAGSDVITIFRPTGPERLSTNRFAFFGDATALPHM